MRQFRLFCITLFTLMALMVFTGCQKDPVTPQASQTENVHETNSNSKTKEKQEANQNRNSETAQKDKTVLNQNGDQNQKASEMENSQNASESDANNSSAKPQNSQGNSNKKSSSLNNEKSSNSEPQTKFSVNQNTSTTPKTNEADKYDASIIVKGDSKTGTILTVSQADFKKGDTVLTMTLNLLKQKGIQYSVRGSGATAYVEGIDNLYEFDDGPTSGWNIYVNGKLLSESAGAMKLSKGDHIVWSYTADYQKDGQG
ncbi:DUF4430 domain-containing protein [Heyndrickxia acidicola]|uniref:DUF4430 domain-containing protein n=1 Tax=Heyndrickxia acidicola TaxID=209389 RepID=A0ABU6MI24_9BACI|nr:DUF4430 domain-containing protein [Heyndrickxia acidicola]MED1204323.1 DUF4430 domain-containing protein [Heyndrickxia acidicola]